MMQVMSTIASQVATRLSSSLLSAILCLTLIASAARAEGIAIELDLEGALGVATAEYIIGGIEQAEEQGANVVIIRMDTPGGLVTPMREIVQAILGSSVPVDRHICPPWWMVCHVP